LLSFILDFDFKTPFFLVPLYFSVPQMTLADIWGGGGEAGGVIQNKHIWTFVIPTPLAPSSRINAQIAPHL
jgi:hypothetical protein